MIEQKTERPRRERVFVHSPEEALVARNILAEAKQFGGEVDHLKVEVVSRVTRRSSLLDYQPEGLIDLRQAARSSVLLAQGVNPEDVGIRSQLYKTWEEVFGRRSISFVVWKDRLGNVLAQGDMNYMVDTPIAQKLLALGPTHRGWEKVVCWNLGIPEHTLDESHEGFKRVQPETPTFLFSDEIEKLKSDGKLLAYIGQDLYEEAFEGYLVDEYPGYGWSTLFKVRAYLFD